MTLAEVSSGNVRVVNIVGGRQAQMRLVAMGINVGSMLVVKRRAIAGGPILINVNGRDVALGRGMAEKVIVEYI